MDAAILAQDILSAPDVEGITISGGEPFLQSEGLFELITLLREKKDLGVIIYTGMCFSEVKNDKLVGLSDLIIDGEYREELNDGLSLRGSSNQNIIQLTSRYSDVIDVYGTKGRKIELHVFNDKVTMVGIPSKNSIESLESNSKK